MRARGFTLLEVLAVIVATSVVMGVALSTYVNISRQITHATDTTRETRRAAAVLDYVARDLERVVLVEKPADLDPLDHPWIFLAEAKAGAAAADHLKFMTRGRLPRSSASPESDIEVVAYAVREGEDASLELWRWTSPRLPESLDRRVPDEESEGALLLAGGLAEFGVTFVDELGEESTTWDSSSLVQASQLPAAAEIRVALAHPDDPEAEPTRYRRRVLLPVRPLDFEELLDPTAAVGGGEKQDEGDDAKANVPCGKGPCARLSVCQALDCSSNASPSITQLLGDIGGQPFCLWRDRLPSAIAFLIRNPGCR
jgi:prepilin-type N-terminal cleavage/methylation domain-containing protein